MPLLPGQLYLAMVVLLNYPTLDHERQCRLRVLAHAIALNQEYEEPARMLAIALQESTLTLRRYWNESSHGACGPYQQIPRYAYPHDEPATCASLQDPYEATYRLHHKLESMRSRYGAISETICHYASGNECNPASIQYAEEHIVNYERAQQILGRLQREEPYSPSLTLRIELHQCVIDYYQESGSALR